MNEELFERMEALTFDDVLIVPGYSQILPRRYRRQGDVHGGDSSQYTGLVRGRWTQ